MAERFSLDAVAPIPDGAEEDANLAEARDEAVRAIEHVLTLERRRDAARARARTALRRYNNLILEHNGQLKLL